tara:strand:- start:6091 stop:7284 length:1194 start_codon:yes stop_codon:yes gene_type:complete
MFAMSSVLKFSFFKYVEFFLLGFTNLILANKLGVGLMSGLMPLLLFITYSSFFSLGGPQAYIKQSSINKFKTNKHLIINYIISVLICLLVFLFFFKVNQYYVFFTALAVLLRSYFIAMCRIKGDIGTINIACLMSSTFIFSAVCLYVDTIETYFLILFTGHLIAIFIYIRNEESLLKRIKVGLSTSLNIKSWLIFIQLGIKLNTLGLLSIFLLSSDRLLMLFVSDNSSVLGTFQLADMMSMLFYLLIVNIHFYFYPKLLRLLKDDKVLIKRYFNWITVISLTSIILCPLAFFLGDYLFPILFPSYKNLELYIFLSLLMKIGVLSLTMQNVVYIAQGKESRLIKIHFIIAAFIISFSLFFNFLYKKYNLADFFIPLSLSIILILISLVFNYANKKANS